MNTHAAFKQLVNSGLQEQIAETVVNIIDSTRRSEFDKLATKDELKIELASLRTEFNNKITNVHTELKEAKATIEGDLLLLKWMVGVTISLIIPILAKIFLTH